MTRRTLKRLNTVGLLSVSMSRLSKWDFVCDSACVRCANFYAKHIGTKRFRVLFPMGTLYYNLAYLLTYYTKEPKACRLVMPTMTSRDSMTSESWCRHDLQSRRIWKLGDYLCGIYNRTLSYNIVLKNQVIPLRTLGEDAIRRDRTSTEIQQISRHNQLPPQCFATYSAM